MNCHKWDHPLRPVGESECIGSCEQTNKKSWRNNRVAAAGTTAGCEASGKKCLHVDSRMGFQSGVLRYCIWVFCPIWSNINLSACTYKLEEGGNDLETGCPGVAGTITDSERGSVYNHSGQYVFSPSLATNLFCLACVGKNPTLYLPTSSPLKTQPSVFSAAGPWPSPCLKLLNPVSKCTMGRRGGG